MYNICIVPIDDSKIAKKWISYDGKCWRGFKAQLITNYIKNPKCNSNPQHEMYIFIYRETWDKFVEFHIIHEFLAKSQKEKENRENNIYPHKLSRGKYDKLEEAMIK